MAILEVAVGFSLLVLTTLRGQTHAVLPYVAEYTPQVLKPQFDHMREYAYGSAMNERRNETCGKDQSLISFMVSHEEIMNSLVNGTRPSRKQQFEQHVNKRVNALPNKKERSWAKYSCDLPVEEEVKFVQNEMVKPKLDDVRKNDPSGTPVLLMYSPCTDFHSFGYSTSCWEWLGIFATIKWKKFGILLAFSENFPGFSSHSGKTVHNFLQLAGVPVFRYQAGSKGKELVQVTAVENADSLTRWRSVTFLPVFFDCLVNSIVHGCLSDRQHDKRAIIAFFVNSAAYHCFREKDFRWRRNKRRNITECFTEYFENNMGSDCTLCAGACAASKKTITQRCLLDSFEKTLVPGAPLESFDPFSDAWRVTRDITLTKLFPDSPQNRRRQSRQKYFCKDRSLSLESLCSASACSHTNHTSPRPGAVLIERLLYYCCICSRRQEHCPNC